MWHLVDFIVCWMLLGPEARRQVYGQLRDCKRRRDWHYGPGGILLIGA